jgi:hypothetical protein
MFLREKAIGYREKAHDLKFKAQGKKPRAYFLYQRLFTLTLIIREYMIAVQENQGCQCLSFSFALSFRC